MRARRSQAAPRRDRARRSRGSAPRPRRARRCGRDAAHRASRRARAPRRSPRHCRRARDGRGAHVAVTASPGQHRLFSRSRQALMRGEVPVRRNSLLGPAKVLVGWPRVAPVSAKSGGSVSALAALLRRRPKLWLAGAVAVLLLVLYPLVVGGIVAHVVASKIGARLGRPVTIAQGRGGLGRFVLRGLTVGDAPAGEVRPRKRQQGRRPSPTRRRMRRRRWSPPRRSRCPSAPRGVAARSRWSACA